MRGKCIPLMLTYELHISRTGLTQSNGIFQWGRSGRGRSNMPTQDFYFCNSELSLEVLIVARTRVTK